jgi:uncharacterized protein (TIGR03437 family)
MTRSLIVLAVLVLRAALAQAPAYTADSIVNASDYSAGPFAPNSVLSIFGSNLSWYTQAMSVSKTAAVVPTELSGVAVYVDNAPTPMLYVSGPQINFLIPSGEITGNVTVRVVREGVTGPEVTIALIDGAPALFVIGTGFAIATHADGTLLTDASPAQPGEIVVIYATGLGPTDPNPEIGEIPETAASMQWLSSLSVSLGGAVLPSYLIKYAGVTPGCVGLYQLNIELPQDVGADPVIQVSVGAKSSLGTLKLAVQ